MFSLISCIGFFALESIYIFALYDPSETKTQAGLMAIFAIEASFLVKIAQGNLQEKKTFGKVSQGTRVYTAIFALPLLVVMAIASGILPFKQYPALWIAMFFISACGKIVWYRKRGKFEELAD